MACSPPIQERKARAMSNDRSEVSAMSKGDKKKNVFEGLKIRIRIYLTRTNKTDLR